MQVAVIGGAECSDGVRKIAYELGKKLAHEGHIIICGGLGGIMEAVCLGANEGGGVAVGILPGDKVDANRWVSIAIATGMGHARNAIIVKSADIVIALPGEYGTLSEMALALKMGKKVISLQSWVVPGAVNAESAEEVILFLESKKNSEMYLEIELQRHIPSRAESIQKYIQLESKTINEGLFCLSC